MRVLLVNNFFRNVGGVERVFFMERDLLRAHGHEVIDFSTAHPDNYPSEYASYFPSGVDFHSGGSLLKKIGRLFYSREVARELTRLIRDTQPDVAHIQGMFDLLGPTVVRVLRAHGIPIVFTTHAYKLVCPSGRLFTEDHIDESCRVSVWNDVVGRAVHGSIISSLGGALALLHNKYMGIFDSFHTIIAPSIFLIHKHHAFGWKHERFIHVPNPIDVTQSVPVSGVGRYMVFAGRLVPEKGLDVLLDAARLCPHIPLMIIGDGPLFTHVQNRILTEGLSQVTMMGRLLPTDVARVIHDARAVVVPSVCFETDPYSVLESQAMGQVVIASHTGGIPEQISDGATGFLVEQGNAGALAQTMRHVWDMPEDQRRAIGKRARAFVDVVRSPELYYESIIDILMSAKKAN